MTEARVIKIVWTQIEGLLHPHLINSGEKLFKVKDLEKGCILYKDEIAGVENLNDFVFKIEVVDISSDDITLSAESTGGYRFLETIKLDKYFISDVVAYGVKCDVKNEVRMYLGVEGIDGVATYVERDLNQIMKELMDIHGYSGAPAFSYKDKERLSELMYLIDKNNDLSITANIQDVCLACISLGLAYLDMERMALVGKYLTLALKYLNELINDVEFMIEEFSNPMTIKFLINTAFHARNYYIEDECQDLKEYAMTLLKDDNMFVFPSITDVKPALKYDPIEMTKEYLDVIDEVEEKIDLNQKIQGIGSLHEKWILKEEYLQDKGIIWDSPKRLNPYVKFE